MDESETAVLHGGNLEMEAHILKEQTEEAYSSRGRTSPGLPTHGTNVHGTCLHGKMNFYLVQVNDSRSSVT